MLDRGRIELGADLLEHRVAGVAIVVEHADLDQFVGGEVDVDLVKHRGRDAVLADADDRMQEVRLGAKGAPFAR